jgi:transposase
MLNFSSATRVFVATAPVDMRGSFNRLYALAQSVLQQDPLSGHWFVFTNRQRNRVKILFWDGSGLWVCAKRLEKGRFSWPQGDIPCARMRGEELIALLSGLDVKAKQNWYRKSDN